LKDGSTCYKLLQPIAESEAFGVGVQEPIAAVPFPLSQTNHIFRLQPFRPWDNREFHPLAVF
jgi:hypothetical protein